MPVTAEVKSMVEAVGGEETIELKLRRFQEDIHFLQSIREQLLRQYLEQWVAVYETSVAAHGKTITELRKKLVMKAIPENEAVIDFIAAERKAMLL